MSKVASFAIVTCLLAMVPGPYTLNRILFAWVLLPGLILVWLLTSRYQRSQLNIKHFSVTLLLLAIAIFLVAFAVMNCSYYRFPFNGFWLIMNTTAILWLLGRSAPVSARSYPADRWGRWLRACLVRLAIFGFWLMLAWYSLYVRSYPHLYLLCLVLSVYGWLLNRWPHLAQTVEAPPRSPAQENLPARSVSPPKELLPVCHTTNWWVEVLAWLALYGAIYSLFCQYWFSASFWYLWLVGIGLYRWERQQQDLARVATSPPQEPVSATSPPQEPVSATSPPVSPPESLPNNASVTTAAPHSAIPTGSTTPEAGPRAAITPQELEPSQAAAEQAAPAEGSQEPADTAVAASPSQPSVATRLAAFLIEHLVTLLLLLGIGLLLAAAIMFLRIHWQTYKLLAFTLFVLVTAACLGSGYYVLLRQKHLPQIGFTMLLLGGLLFPLNFYFAVRVGLLPDSGNRYIVLWLTTALFAAHALWLRSLIFTALATVIMSWAHWALLAKFLAPHYEWFGVAFLLPMLLLLGAALWFQRCQQQCTSLVLQGATHLVYLGALLLGVLWWQPRLFCLLSAGGMALALAQNNYWPHTWFRWWSSWLGACSLVLFLTTASISLPLPLFWRGVVILTPLFMVARYGPQTTWLRDQNIPLRYLTYLVPILLWISYVACGAATAGSNLGLLASAVVTCSGYTFINRQWRQASITYLVIAASGLILWQLLLYWQANVIGTAIGLLAWSLLLAIAAMDQRMVISPWLGRPLLHSSQLIVPPVLLVLVCYIPDYLHSQFGWVSTSLVLAMVFYSLVAWHLQRRDLLAAGLGLLAVLLAIHVQHYNLQLQHFCLLLVGAAIVMLALWQTYASVCAWIGSADFLMLPLVFGATSLAFVNGLLQGLWQTKLVMGLGSAFFILKFYLQRRGHDGCWALVYATLTYWLCFYRQVRSEAWGLMFLLAALLALSVARWQLPYRPRLTKLLRPYALLLWSLALAQLLLYGQHYYYSSSWGVLLTWSLALVYAGWWLGAPSRRGLYLLWALVYLACFCSLPRDCFAFEYALFFLPLALGQLWLSRTYFPWSRPAALWGSAPPPAPTAQPCPPGERTLAAVVRPVCFWVAHATVLFFLLLPAVLPGVTPTALITMLVLLLAFLFGGLGLYYYAHPLYAYCSGGLFLAALLAGLWATGRLWGPQMTLIMAGANFVLIGLGYLLAREGAANSPRFRLGLAFWRVSLLCLGGLLGSVALQGRIDRPTLFTLMACSLAAAVLARHWQTYYWISPAGLSYLAVGLGALAYYLLLEYWSLAPDYLVLQYVALAFISLALARTLKRASWFGQAFEYLTVLAPVVALSHAGDGWQLTLLLLCSAAVYGFGACYWQDGFVAFLGLAAVVLAGYAALSHWNAPLLTFMLWSVFTSQLLIASGRRLAVAVAKPDRGTPDKHWAAQAWERASLLAQFPFFLFWALDPVVNMLPAILLGLMQGLLLLGWSQRRARYQVLATGYLLLAYYLTIHWWAIHLWECYTIPPGLLLIAWGYHQQRTRGSSAWHQEAYLAGLLLIMLPTLVQSYHAWFAHLYSAGLLSPFHHLYYSMLLSIESLVALFWGLYRRKLIFFFSGLAFLISDVLLLILTYVNFGAVPQAVWWGGLGSLLIVCAWTLEYRRSLLQDLYTRLLQWQRRCFQELRSWD